MKSLSKNPLITIFTNITMTIKITIPDYRKSFKLHSLNESKYKYFTLAWKNLCVYLYKGLKFHRMIQIGKIQINV